MKRLLLIILLFLNSAPAYAEWVAVGERDSGTTVYVDRDTIRRKGDLVKMWSLLDFKTLQTVASVSFLSSKTQWEFDCAEERMRQLAYTWFSGNMGSGNAVHSSANEGKLESVTPDSVGQALWIVACGKK